MTIGKRIQSLRKENGMSQEELAEVLDVSKQSVSKWELEKALPNIEKLIKMCEIFDVSSDYLLMGKNLEKSVGDENEEVIEPEPVKENIIHNAAIQEQKKRKKTICLIGMIISFIITVALFIGVYNIVIYNNMGIESSDEQSVAYVESISNQHTIATVVYWNEDGETIKETIYLDLNGVNEGDWIFCYPDGEDNMKVRFQYSNKTCFWLIVLFCVALICWIAFLVLFLMHTKNKKKIIATINLILCVLLCGCGAKENSGDKTTENISKEEAYDDESVDTLEDEWIWEEKQESALHICGDEVRFSVPEGLYSTGITEYEDNAHESFYTEDMMICYNVYLGVAVDNLDLEEYGRRLYSQVETTYSDSTELVVQDEVTESGVEVKTIKIVEKDDDGDYFVKIFSGTVLDSGKLFEVEVKVTSDDKDAISFEDIYDFFNNLDEKV